MSQKSQSLPVLKQILSSLFAAISFMMLKQIKELELNQILYFRSSLSIVMLIAMAKAHKLEIYNFDKQTFNSLVIRGVLGGLGSFLYFQGLKLVLVSESILLNRTCPLWTSMLSIFVMKSETFTKKLLINMILCAVGIYLIARNKTETNQIDTLSYSHIFGLFLILFAAVINAIVNILVKLMSSKIDSSIVTLYQSFFSLILATLSSLIGPTDYRIPSIQCSFLVFLMSTISLLSGVLQIQALREGNLSVVSNVSQVQIPLGYLIDLIVFKEQLNGEQIFGNLLLLGSLIPLIWKS